MIIITFNNKTVQEILNDDDYQYKQILEQIIKRIRGISKNITEEIKDEKISYIIREMEFIRVEPLDTGVKVTTEFYYERIVDLANKYDVDYHNGKNGTDIISYTVSDKIDIQYSISLAQQAFTRFKRLIL